ncbi:MAG: hypothetical protein ACXVI0_11115, partial [Halobacteriota archaeon]
IREKGKQALEDALYNEIAWTFMWLAALFTPSGALSEKRTSQIKDWNRLRWFLSHLLSVDVYRSAHEKPASLFELQNARGIEHFYRQLIAVLESVELKAETYESKEDRDRIMRFLQDNVHSDLSTWIQWLDPLKLIRAMTPPDLMSESRANWLVKVAAQRSENLTDALRDEGD